MYCNYIYIVREVYFDSVGNITPNSRKTACNIGANIPKQPKTNTIQKHTPLRVNKTQQKTENTPSKPPKNAR